MAIITYNLLYFFNYPVRTRTFVNLVCFKLVPLKSVSQKKRGSKLLRCGAKRPVAAFAGTRVYLLSLILFDEGRNWASAPHSVGVYSHASLLHKRRTVGALLAAPSKFRPPSSTTKF